MKKLTILAVLVLVAGASCTKQVPVTNNSPDLPISFNAVTGVRTKADINSAVYPTNASFDVWAVYTGDADFAYNTAGGEVFMNGVAQSYNADKNAWASATPYYWPKAGKLSFWAVHPSGQSPTVSLTGASKTITKTGWTLTNAEPDGAKDLMFSDIVANKTADDYKGHGVDDATTGNDTGFGDYQGVNILFHHALSRIEFKAKKGNQVNTNETLTITNITVNGAKSVGNVTVTAPGILAEGTPTSAFSAADANVVWDNQATPLALTPLTSESAALTTTAEIMGTDRLVIPQVTNGNVSFTVTVKSTIGSVSATKNYTYNLLGAHEGAWKWGKKYIYTLVLNEDGIYFDPAVVDWDSVNYIFPDLVVLDKTHLEFTSAATQALTATVYPNDATETGVTWSSSDEGVATVSSAGVVTPVADGTATITVTTNVGGLTATCLVTVDLP